MSDGMILAKLCFPKIAVTNVVFPYYSIQAVLAISKNLRELTMGTDLLCSISSSEHASICLRYWARKDDGTWMESLAAICQTLGSGQSDLENLVSTNCVAYACDVRCKACGIPSMVVTRAQYEKLHALSKNDGLPCGSATCELERRPLNAEATAAMLNQRVDLIEEVLQSLRQNLRSIDYTDLSFLDTFYLYCVLRASQDGWCGNELPSLLSHSVVFAPTRLLADQAYRRLRQERIIIPSVHSPITAFNISGANNAPITFDVNRVAWTLANSSPHLDNVKLLCQLRAKLDLWTRQTGEELRLRLLEHECVNLIVCGLRNLNVEVDATTEIVLISAVQSGVRHLPVRTVMLVIEIVFADLAFRKAIRNSKGRQLGEVASKALFGYIEKMPLSQFTPDIQSTAADSLLSESGFLISQVFYECFLA